MSSVQDASQVQHPGQTNPPAPAVVPSPSPSSTPPTRERLTRSEHRQRRAQDVPRVIREFGTNFVSHSAVEGWLVRHADTLKYKFPCRPRPPYAMIQCRWTYPPHANDVSGCRYRERCNFGHEEDRYDDSPYIVQHFSGGCNTLARHFLFENSWRRDRGGDLAAFPLLPTPVPIANIQGFIDTIVQKQLLRDTPHWAYQQAISVSLGGASSGAGAAPGFVFSEEETAAIEKETEQLKELEQQRKSPASPLPAVVVSAVDVPASSSTTPPQPSRPDDNAATASPKEAEDKKERRRRHNRKFRTPAMRRERKRKQKAAALAQASASHETAPASVPDGTRRISLPVSPAPVDIPVPPRPQTHIGIIGTSHGVNAGAPYGNGQSLVGGFSGATAGYSGFDMAGGNYGSLYSGGMGYAGGYYVTATASGQWQQQAYPPPQFPLHPPPPPPPPPPPTMPLTTYLADRDYINPFQQPIYPAAPQQPQYPQQQQYGQEYRY